MKPFDACPLCGGKLRSKQVEKLIRGGNNIATVKVKADICLKCGERLYRTGDVRRFEEIRMNLVKDDVKTYHPLGKSFEVS
jgi:YgiT-type zinc finger domain-containing protein